MGVYARCFPEVVSSLLLFLHRFAHILILALTILYCDYWLSKCVNLFAQSSGPELNSAGQSRSFSVVLIFAPTEPSAHQPGDEGGLVAFLLNTDLKCPELSSLRVHTVIHGWIQDAQVCFLPLKPGLGYLIRAGWLKCVAWNYYK